MTFYKKLRDSVKDVSLPVWIAGVCIPGGLTLIALYLAYKTSKKKNTEETIQDFVDSIKKENDNE